MPRMVSRHPYRRGALRAEQTADLGLAPQQPQPAHCSQEPSDPLLAAVIPPFLCFLLVFLTLLELRCQAAL